MFVAVPDSIFVFNEEIGVTKLVLCNSYMVNKPYSDMLHVLCVMDNMYRPEPNIISVIYSFVFPSILFEIRTKDGKVIMEEVPKSHWSTNRIDIVDLYTEKLKRRISDLMLEYKTYHPEKEAVLDQPGSNFLAKL